jgi:riboflavin kinase/FMN adenylyltransferase
MEGPIVHGDKLGRTFGYPTANIDLDDYLRPRVGIYAVEASLDENGRAGPWMGGVASLGFRPTVGGSDLRFEVHLFDFSADIYGRRLRVRPVRYLRDEMKLDGTGALIRQMREDEAEARAILATRAEVDAGAAIKNKSGKNKSGAAPGRGSR